MVMIADYTADDTGTISGFTLKTVDAVGTQKYCIPRTTKIHHPKILTVGKSTERVSLCMMGA